MEHFLKPDELAIDWDTIHLRVDAEGTRFAKLEIAIVEFIELRAILQAKKELAPEEVAWIESSIASMYGFGDDPTREGVAAVWEELKDKILRRRGR